MALVVRTSCVRRRASAARRRRASARPRPARCAAPAAPAARRARARRPRWRRGGRSRRACRPPCRRGTASCRPATGPGAPSTPTRQTRQAPNGAWRSSKHSVGTCAAGGAGGVEHRRAGRDLELARRRARTLITSQPQLVGEVREQAADRRRHAAAVGAQAAELERLEQLLELARGRPAASASNISCARRRPDPAGEALAAALGGAEVQQVRGDRAHVGRARRRRRSRRGRPCSPPRRAASKSNDGVELEAGQDAAERAADLQRLDRPAVAHAAGDVLAQLAHRSSRTAPRRRRAGRSAR